MTLEYTPLALTDMNAYLALLAETHTCSSDYSFANLWGWAPHFELEWRFDGTLCWIRQRRPEPLHWAPIGPWHTVKDWTLYPEMASGAQFIRVPDQLCSIWEEALPGKIHREEDRANWDYLYLSSELTTLSGNRFHKKKNLLKQFEKTYEYSYQSLTGGCVDTVMNMQAEWCRWRDCEGSETLLAENDAVARVLARWNEIPGLCGGIIRIDDEPVAYTLAEALNEETLVIHFEKGKPGIKGIYQAINYYFSNDMGKHYTYINREQDLGDEGLRQAKLSYNPVDFAKKCTISLL